MSSFVFESTNQQNIKLSLDRTNVNDTDLQLYYSSKNSSTIISLLKIDILIFDRYNPSFKYATGVISQSYLTTRLTLQIPKEGLSELRTFIIGLNSFEVSVNTAISIYTALNRIFSLEIGPISSHC